MRSVVDPVRQKKRPKTRYTSFSCSSSFLTLPLPPFLPLLLPPVVRSRRPVFFSCPLARCPRDRRNSLCVCFGSDPSRISRRLAMATTAWQTKSPLREQETGTGSSVAATELGRCEKAHPSVQKAAGRATLPVRRFPSRQARVQRLYGKSCACVSLLCGWEGRKQARNQLLYE